jgi:hypothetical protein
LQGADLPICGSPIAPSHRTRHHAQPAVSPRGPCAATGTPFRPNNHQKWCLNPRLVDLCILSIFYPYMHRHVPPRHLPEFLRAPSAGKISSRIGLAGSTSHALIRASYFLSTWLSRATLHVKFKRSSPIQNQFLIGSPILSVQPELAGFKPIWSTRFEGPNWPNPPLA